MKHYSIKVHGQVQGVFFRVHARDAAKVLGLHGWVTNNTEGTVSIEAEGEQKSLDQLVHWCKEGSPEAKVSKVEVIETQVTNLSDFIILR